MLQAVESPVAPLPLFRSGRTLPGRDRESNHPCRADLPPALALERDANPTRMNDTNPVRVNAMHAPMRLSAATTIRMSHAGPARIREARHMPCGHTCVARIGAILASHA
jgi:hypothetical protein